MGVRVAGYLFFQKERMAKVSGFLGFLKQKMSKRRLWGSGRWCRGEQAVFSAQKGRWKWGGGLLCLHQDF
jgi:hypothetical protein